MTRRLLALDLDGTLLHHDGTIDPRDVAAVKRAQDEGVTVTIATGRVSTGTLPTARLLGLEDPLVCADGGLLICGRTGVRLEQQSISLKLADHVLSAATEHSLAQFVLLHDSVHCDELGRAHCDYVSVWTTDITIHPRLADATEWRREGEVALTVSIGDREAVLAAFGALEGVHTGSLDLVHFKVNRDPERWALLSRPFGCNKGAALARVAQRLGIETKDTAAVGDWLNDVSMLTWAGRSFAMGQAPDAVRRVATDQLRATNATGGGVAEAIERWLG